MDIKVRIKSLTLEKLSNKNLYFVSFVASDTKVVCNKIFVNVLKNNQISQILENTLFDLPVSKDIFSFLSSHSKETFIITLDNTSNSLVKVELVYD